MPRRGFRAARSIQSGVSTPPSEQRVAVFTALVANVAVAIAKVGAFAITGSSAMLAAKARIRAAVPFRTVIYLEPLVDAPSATPPV